MFFNMMHVRLQSVRTLQTQWIGKNVNLDALSKLFVGFLESQGFKVNMDKSGGTYTLLGALRQDDETKSVVVTIKGNPKDFIVEFLGHKMGRFSMMVSSFASMFGGGIFVRGGLKSYAFYERLERDFWILAEEAVERSAELSSVS